MTLTDAASLAQVVGAVAVVASLIFVGLQIRGAKAFGVRASQAQDAHRLRGRPGMPLEDAAAEARYGNPKP